MLTDTIKPESQEEYKGIIISDTTVIDYPSEELKILKKCMSYSGFITQCRKSTGVTDPTLRKFLKDKRGVKKGVDAVVVFAHAFYAQFINKKKAS